MSFWNTSNPIVFSPHPETMTNAWKTLIVDDDPEVHTVTQLALRRYQFEGQGLEYLSAFSAEEAYQILRTHADIAVIFLDVIMEEPNSGLSIVRCIREELKNRSMRIILRTGQPDEVPEGFITSSYDINDYRTKTELSQTRLITTLTSALRSYRDILALEQQSRELQRLTNRLRYQANHDALTGLVNRGEFERRLSCAIDVARENFDQHALCYIDLDQFRVINDTCGHIAGDELLRQLSLVFIRAIRDGDTVARIGGDEFAVLMERCSFVQAKDIAERILQAIRDFCFSWESKTLKILASIGLVPIDSESEGVINVLRSADNLSYLAKDRGGDQVYIYASNDSDLVRRRDELQMMSRLKDAIEKSRLQLYFQPIVSTTTINHQLHHYEILVRMLAEDGSIISPGLFLGVAEKYNLSVQLDQWVISHVFRWLALHPDHLSNLELCSINLSGLTLSDETFKDKLVDILQATRIPTEKICFELTETIAITNFTRAVAFIEEIKSYGCKFALDDFGTGFSSFAYLKHFPVDYLKIDGVFVKDILKSPIDEAFVTSINDIAKAMGKKTIAEYVESPEILDRLQEIGVDYAQGYAIAKPQPLDSWHKVISSFENPN